MDARQRLAVHLPREDDLLAARRAHLAQRDRDGVVEHVALWYPIGVVRTFVVVSYYVTEGYRGTNLFEVRVCADELQMLALGQQAAACTLEHLLERYASIYGGPAVQYTE